SQDVIVRTEDCKTKEHIDMAVLRDGEPNPNLVGRFTAAKVVTKRGRELLGKNAPITKAMLAEIVEGLGEEPGATVPVRSVLKCEAEGVCQHCYGVAPATGKLVAIGDAVGIIAAQSIGEPGTQLTMRTFHLGGVAGLDITHGLPRVVELFEARKPKGEAQIVELTGSVEIIEGDKAREIKVTSEDGKEEVVYKVPGRAKLRVKTGDTVEVGQQIAEGSVNPHEILRIQGPQAVQLFLVGEVQKVYHSQGVTIHDKHIELIVRQMLRRVNVLEPGDAEFLPGQLVERKAFEGVNRRVVGDGGDPASARPMLMGITKASLATDSWLSAASFQETTRVLTDAAISAKSDPLLGLKENVIIGKLIPAGTGMARYRTIKVFPTEMPERLYPVGADDESPLMEEGARPFEMPVPPQFAVPPEEAYAEGAAAAAAAEGDGAPLGDVSEAGE
ncbi:MAG TPA: hypothetical protein VM841_00720, partial [Actinomycetota bacterium]|nr:hypothetical protein [Actinomycetota bacterium]